MYIIWRLRKQDSDVGSYTYIEQWLNSGWSMVWWAIDQPKNIPLNTVLSACSEFVHGISVISVTAGSPFIVSGELPLWMRTAAFAVRYRTHRCTLNTVKNSKNLLWENGLPWKIRKPAYVKITCHLDIQYVQDEHPGNSSNWSNLDRSVLNGGAKMWTVAVIQIFSDLIPLQDVTARR